MTKDVTVPRTLRLVEEVPEAPEGGIHALATYLRANVGKTVALELSPRCEPQCVRGRVVSVSVTSSHAVMKVRGHQLSVPLADVKGILI